MVAVAVGGVEGHDEVGADLFDHTGNGRGNLVEGGGDQCPRVGGAVHVRVLPVEEDDSFDAEKVSGSVQLAFSYHRQRVAIVGQLRGACLTSGGTADRGPHTVGAGSSEKGPTTEALIIGVGDHDEHAFSICGH